MAAEILNQGPISALIAAYHGCENPPILALQKLRGQIDPRLGGADCS